VVCNNFGGVIVSMCRLGQAEVSLTCVFCLCHISCQDMSRRLYSALIATHCYCTAHCHRIGGFNLKLCVKHNMYVLCNGTKLVLWFSLNWWHSINWRCVLVFCNSTNKINIKVFSLLFCVPNPDFVALGWHWSNFILFSLNYGMLWLSYKTVCAR
jgi:hypothetical protein